MSNNTLSKSMYEDSDLLKLGIHDLIVEKSENSYTAKFIKCKNEEDENSKEEFQIPQRLEVDSIEKAYSMFKELLSKNLFSN